MSIRERWYRIRMAYWYLHETHWGISVYEAWDCACGADLDFLDMDNTTPRDNVKGDISYWGN